MKIVIHTIIRLNVCIFDGNLILLQKGRDNKAMKTRPQRIRKAFRAAFPHTIPIFAGFWFLGMTYGIYMNVSGFPFWYPMIMSLVIFAGSVEFVAVNMLLGAFNPLQALAMTLMINARHLFYGISMLDRFRGLGWKKIYLIFGMCDETFSINYTAEPPEDVDRGWFMFFVTLLNHFYWFFGATLGGIFGSLIHFSTEGLDFVMVAMFVVIFLEQWLKEKDHTSSLLGVAISLVCLTAFGADEFIIPAMLAMLGVLTLLRKPVETKMSEGEEVPAAQTEEVPAGQTETMGAAGGEAAANRMAAADKAEERGEMS